MLTDGRTHACTDDGRKVITMAHPEHSSGELKKGIDYHVSVNNLLKRHLPLNRLMDFEIILQECFLSDPLPKLLKWCRSDKQNGIQSKKENL